MGLLTFIYFGVFTVIWVFLVSLFYPQRDRRYKTGYKNNQLPDESKIKKFNKWYWIVICSIFVISAVITALTPEGASQVIESNEDVSVISVYIRPNNQSTIIDKISEDVKYEIIGETKYFHQIHYQDSLKGYILK